MNFRIFAPFTVVIIFMMARLSHQRELGPILVSRVPTSVHFRNHLTWSASDNALYSISSVDSDVVFCFRDDQVTGLALYVKIDPKIDFRSPVFPESMHH